jgi:hypothetical protein
MHLVCSIGSPLTGSAGNNGPVSTATASSFLNCPGVRCGRTQSGNLDRQHALEQPAALRKIKLSHLASLAVPVSRADEPLARQAAGLCRKAGAGLKAIPAWIAEGRRRRAATRQPPFSGGVI